MRRVAVMWMRPQQSDEAVEAEAGTNPILALLDRIGLPWRSTRRALVRRYPVRPHDLYGWNAIPVGSALPVAGGLLGPLWAQSLPLASSVLPATYFSGTVWYGGDAPDNLRRARDDVATSLGPAEIEQSGNVLRSRWSVGAASVRLTVWPSAGAENPAATRDPRLKAACSIEVETGYRPPLRAEEQAWLAAFVPQGGTGFATSAGEVRTSAASEVDLAFVREPPDDLAPLLGRVGRAADRAALIACTSQLYVVPSTRIAAFRLQRIRPARGPGGSVLEVEARACDGDPCRRLTIARADRPGDLDRLAVELASAWSRPCRIEVLEDV